MIIELPDPPVRLGCSRRVRRRVRESVPAVRVAFASIEILGEAIERRWGEAIERHREQWEREAREAVGKSERPITVADLVYGIGCEIRRLAEAMVDADEELDRARRHRRRLCRERDAAGRLLYGELGRFRKHARGILRPRRARLVPELRGETFRDPQLLVRQTDDCLRWAASRDDAPPGAEVAPEGRQRNTWKAMTAPLVPLRNELDAALTAVDGAGPAIQAALHLRDRAMAEYDDRYSKGARLLESLYTLLGMPSLAAAVRPHRKVTARVGRPSKQPEADEHPDLVARVLARLRAAPAP